MSHPCRNPARVRHIYTKATAPFFRVPRGADGNRPPNAKRTTRCAEKSGDRTRIVPAFADRRRPPGRRRMMECGCNGRPTIPDRPTGTGSVPSRKGFRKRQHVRLGSAGPARRSLLRRLVPARLQRRRNTVPDEPILPFYRQNGKPRPPVPNWPEGRRRPGTTRTVCFRKKRLSRRPAERKTVSRHKTFERSAIILENRRD